MLDDLVSLEDFVLIVASYILSLVTDDKNNFLVKCPNLVEVKHAFFFSLNGDKAPGLDGFDGYFYHTFWDIVGVDVCKVVQQFF